MANIRGRFLWYELMTTNVDAAKAFYTQVATWGTTVHAPDSDKPYMMWVAGDRPVGGVYALPKEALDMGAAPHWVAYVGTSDVDATAARAVALGGKLYKEPADIPDVGRFAMLADPQGATFALFQPADASQIKAKERSALGEVSWHELYTTDPEAAWTFYSDLFAWEHTSAMDMGDMGTYQMYGLPGTGVSLGGFMRKPEMMPGPPAWLYYITVADVDATAKAATGLGAHLVNGPMDIPGGGRIAMMIDPQGAGIAFYSEDAEG